MANPLRELMRTIFDHEAVRKGIYQIVDLGPVDTIVILPAGSLFSKAK